MTGAPVADASPPPDRSLDQPSDDRRPTDARDTDWDAFVAAGQPGSYLQLAGWAQVKAVNGWTSRRIRSASGDAAAVGAQVLLRQPRPLPWAFAYAPRGPVTAAWSPRHDRGVH